MFSHAPRPGSDLLIIIHSQHRGSLLLVAILVLRGNIDVILDSLHEASLFLFGGGLSGASLEGATVGATALSAAGADKDGDEAAKAHDEARGELANVAFDE